MIDVEGLVISYNEGAVKAVKGVDLHVRGGEVLGLLGGNGAGKTSTLRAIASVIPPTSGSIWVAGHNLSDPAGAESARSVLGYCPDTAGVIRQGTVREHIGVALGLRGRAGDWSHAMALLEQFGLLEVLDRETAGFSHGMSRRLSVMLATLTATDALILDEPFDGVDPLGVRATEAVIQAARAGGLAVIVSTHLLHLLARVTDRICVMVDGKIVDDAPSSDFSGEAGDLRYESLLAGA